MLWTKEFPNAPSKEFAIFDLKSAKYVTEPVL